MKKVFLGLAALFSLQFTFGQELILYYQVSTYLTYDEIHVYAFNKSGRELDLSSIHFAILFDSTQNHSPSISVDLLENHFSAKESDQRELKVQPFEMLDESVSPPEIKRTYQVNGYSLNYMLSYKSQMNEQSGEAFPLPDNGALLDVMTLRMEKVTAGLEPDIYLAPEDAFSDTKLLGSDGGELKFEVDLITSITYPVEWLSFEARQKGPQSVNLKWTTASESNNQGFQIERSIDGRLFNPIAFVDGIGNSSSSRDYDYLDTEIDGKLYYYRLRQQDRDGRYSYSQTTMVNLDMGLEPKISLYPNPVKDMLNLEFLLSDEVNFYYIVLSADGKLIQEGRIKEDSDSKMIMDVSNYSSGIYRISLYREGSFEFYSQSFVVFK
ncbi:MAG: T9SS type A sorting domain-containing protein [Bacteroidia bacterium]|nr:T9SS type A sorting domain-containing protein [Bacteroidia bacterium]